MVKSILIIVFAVFAISGICELIHTICILLAAPNKPFNNYCVLYLKRDNAYYQIRFALEQIRWQGKNFAAMIIAVTDDISESERLKCKALANDNNIILCPSEILPNVIKSVSEVKNA